MSAFNSFITLTSVSDGDSLKYNIVSTSDKILKFIETAEDGGTFLSFSPDPISVRLKNPITDEDLEIENYEDRIYISYSDIVRMNFFNFLKSFAIKNTSPVETVYDKFKEYAPASGGARSKEISYHLNRLVEYNSTSDAESMIEPIAGSVYSLTDYRTFIRSLEEDSNLLLEIDLFTNNNNSTGELIAQRNVSIEFGTSRDMAQFNILKSKVETIVNNAAMQFDANGLTIRNGDFKIIDQNGNTVFSFVKNGSLEIVGNGTFSGDVTATSGSIAGFIINGNQIISNGLIIQSASGEDINDSKIIVSNIELGTGAKVQDYIQLGENTYLYNPDLQKNNNQVFSMGDSLKITSLGEIILGGISMDGRTSSISGTNFSITPSLASFSNISASGKISTVIFEQNHVQSVGGSMIFKPSYKILNVSNLNITIEGKFNGVYNSQRDYYIYLIGQEGQMSPLRKITNVNNTNANAIITVDSLNGMGDPVSLIDVGEVGDILIGINSGGSSGFMQPRGLTISELTNNATYIPKAFLGDLSQVSGAGLSGYGLFSENVYLNGSLVTKSNENGTYAGVNTINGVSATKFDINAGNIIFWAGANSNSNRDIQDSPFQVTEKGFLYAQKGLFEGAIITKSELRGTDIYGARIHGAGSSDTDNYGLSFYDSSEGISKGIIFYNGIYGNSPEEVFNIRSSGLYNGDNAFISINENGKASFNGDLVELEVTHTGGLPSNLLKIDGTHISYSYGTTEYNMAMDMNDINDAKLKMSPTGNPNNYLQLNNNNIELNSTNTVYLNGENVYLSRTMMYKKVIENSSVIGVDLYIEEAK